MRNETKEISQFKMSLYKIVTTAMVTREERDLQYKPISKNYLDSLTKTGLSTYWKRTNWIATSESNRQNMSVWDQQSAPKTNRNVFVHETIGRG